MSKLFFTIPLQKIIYPILRDLSQKMCPVLHIFVPSSSLSSFTLGSSFQAYVQ